jgi:hypothetical protein
VYVVSTCAPSNFSHAQKHSSPALKALMVEGSTIKGSLARPRRYGGRTFCGVKSVCVCVCVCVCVDMFCVHDHNMLAAIAQRRASLLQHTYKAHALHESCTSQHCIYMMHKQLTVAYVVVCWCIAVVLLGGAAAAARYRCVRVCQA